MLDGEKYAHLRDEAVPAVPILLGPEAVDVLGAVVGPQGGTLKSIGINQIRYVPGRSILVRYKADVAWKDGRSSRESLVASAGIDVPDDVPVLAAGDVEVALWAYPNDPFLPGLPIAADPQRTRRLLSQLGVETRKTRLRLRSYRPTRRAVIEVTTPQARIYLKVVRPDRVADLQQKHTALAGALPVPHSHGWNADLGLVALQSLPGKPLRKAMESGSRRLPAAQQFISLLDSFPEAMPVSDRVTGPDERTEFYARLLKVVTPELTQRIDAIVEQTKIDDSAERVPVHGDFHSSQLLTRGTDIVGLIDVDTAGVGERRNDLAVLLAHMSSVALTTSARRRIDRYGAELIKEFDARVDPVALRRKVAAAVFGLATGPFRVGLARWPAQTERRIALVEQWIESAHAVARP